MQFSSQSSTKISVSSQNDLKLGQVAVTDKPVQRVSLKEKLETYKAQVAGTGKANIEKAKGKEDALSL